MKIRVKQSIRTILPIVLISVILVMLTALLIYVGVTYQDPIAFTIGGAVFMIFTLFMCSLGTE